MTNAKERKRLLLCLSVAMVVLAGLTSVPPDEKTMRAQAIEPLSSTVLRKRAIEIFPIGYLTLIAIIQGAVFGLLVVTASAKLTEHHRQFLVILAVVAQSLTVFTAIIVVTQLYVQLTVLVRWVPSAVDTVLLYLIGLSELIMAITIGIAWAWWAALALLLAVGALSFIRSHRNSSIAIFGGNKAIYDRFKHALGGQVASCSTTFLLCLLAIGLDLRHIGGLWIDSFGPFIVIAGGIVIEIQGDIDQNRIYDELGIPRRTSR